MMRPIWRACLLAAFAFDVLPGGVSAQTPQPAPLFASHDPIRLTIRTDLRQATRSDEGTPATLTLQGDAPETHRIEVSPRGVSRRRPDICTFPPLRLEWSARPASGMFAGQRRLKLVTHCRPREAHDQYVLLEYAAYRLYNELTERSFRVRLAEIEYFDGDAERPQASRIGFLIEDVDDAAARSGLVEIERNAIPRSQLDRADTARVALFQYMIGNLDWAVQAGAQGEDCCHNTRPIGAAEDATIGLVPLPYDFDHAGFVSAPYATPPAQIRVANIRTRVFRGFCAHNAETRAAAAEFLAARPRLEAVLAAIPGLSDASRSRALAYLGSFFDAIATPQDIEHNLLDACVS